MRQNITSIISTCGAKKCAITITIIDVVQKFKIERNIMEDIYESKSDLKSTKAVRIELPSEKFTKVPTIVTNDIYVLTIPYSFVVNKRVNMGIVKNAIALLNRLPNK